MPRPYLIAICRGSSLDQSTNNMSLFGLVEQVQAASVPSDVPLEFHLHYEFDEAERGRDYEVRALILERGSRQRWESGPVPIKSPTPRFRLSIHGFRLPAFGTFDVFAEVREARLDGEWERSPFSWPLEITKLVGPDDDSDGI